VIGAGLAASDVDASAGRTRHIDAIAVTDACRNPTADPTASDA
jgi:hypothetical protein